MEKIIYYLLLWAVTIAVILLLMAAAFWAMGWLVVPIGAHP
jgi:hypothetical protein